MFSLRLEGRDGGNGNYGKIGRIGNYGRIEGMGMVEERGRREVGVDGFAMSARRGGRGDIAKLLGGGEFLRRLFGGIVGGVDGRILGGDCG